ncbi:peptidoglycan editing factor PgeF [Cellulomonas xiejunii]|uniref:peptidoglycan editing factor PgeF n=1 Tax=Cellulomonas xiejunii TaxID=2968083 RepID=UPI001D0E2E62|nr:peptidoglycan editing factor PgeF [Cellulomonas xiejunii]MCC2316247.1 peptidoglycan editing factor PgeF [Cellulomonas xiejunii]
MQERPGPLDDVPLHVVGLGPGVLAGFTSRAGGTSVGPWRGLDLGLQVGDDPDAVTAHRRALEHRVGVRVVFATQVHGARVVRVPQEVVDGTRADGLVTRSADVAVAVYVADCAPVLLADPVARVVAAAHAGRQGLVAGVLQATVDAMVRDGADPARVAAAIGPCIAGTSYEVPAAMRDEVAAVVPEAACLTPAGTPAVDLAAGVRAVLLRCGLAPSAVHVDGRDTYRDAALYSHRRAVHDGIGATGRFAGVVRLLDTPGAASG